MSRDAGRLLDSQATVPGFTFPATLSTELLIEYYNTSLKQSVRFVCGSSRKGLSVESARCLQQVG